MSNLLQNDRLMSFAFAGIVAVLVCTYQTFRAYTQWIPHATRSVMVRDLAERVSLTLVLWGSVCSASTLFMYWPTLFVTIPAFCIGVITLFWAESPLTETDNASMNIEEPPVTASIEQKSTRARNTRTISGVRVMHGVVVDVDADQKKKAN